MYKCVQAFRIYEWNSTKSNEITIQWYRFVCLSFFHSQSHCFHQYVFRRFNFQWNIKRSRKINSKWPIQNIVLNTFAIFHFKLLTSSGFFILFGWWSSTISILLLHFFNFLRYTFDVLYISMLIFDAINRRDFVAHRMCTYLYLYLWVDCWHGNTQLFYVCYVPKQSCIRAQLNRAARNITGNVQLCSTVCSVLPPILEFGFIFLFFIIIIPFWTLCNVLSAIGSWVSICFQSFYVRAARLVHCTAVWQNIKIKWFYGQHRIEY